MPQCIEPILEKFSKLVTNDMNQIQFKYFYRRGCVLCNHANAPNKKIPNLRVYPLSFIKDIGI